MRIGPRAEVVCDNLTCRPISGVSLTWINEFGCLGVYIVKSRVVQCSFEFAKRSFYRTAKCKRSLHKYNSVRRGYIACRQK